MQSLLKILSISMIGTIAMLGFVGCSSESRQSQATRAESSSERTPEQDLAIIDKGGAIAMGDERPYAQLLDAAEAKCTEDRRAIADLTAKVVEVTTKEGARTSNLDVLTGASKVLAEYNQPQKCQDIFTSLALVMIGDKK